MDRAGTEVSLACGGSGSDLPVSGLRYDMFLMLPAQFSSLHAELKFLRDLLHAVSVKRKV